MSPEKEAYIRQLIKKTKELGHEVLIQNGEPEYDSSLDWRSEEGRRKFEEFQLDREALGKTVLYLIDIIPDYRYWPTLFGINSENWYRVVNFDVSIVDTNNDLYVWIGIDHDNPTKDNPAFEKEPDEEVLKEILSRPLYQTLREIDDGRIRGRAGEIEQVFIQSLGRDSVTVRDLCNNFMKVYCARNVGRHIGGEIYDYLVDELGIPKDKIRC